MRRIPLLTLLFAVIFTASCSKKTSEIANSIPDNAFVVATVHPQQIHDKGQIASFEKITTEIDNEFLREIVKDPVKSGLAINEYAYFFSYFVDDDPFVGATAVLKDAKMFTSMITTLIAGEDVSMIEFEGYSMVAPDNDDAALAWNDKQVIFLSSPELNKSTDDWKTQLITLFDLPKEESVTTIVDFNNFAGKMKDMNIWFTGDEFKKLLEKSGKMDSVNINLPMDLKNNYVQLFVDFDEGAMNIHSETHLSDEVSKATETFMVAKENLNADLLELAPGNDLLMAMAFSVELDKMVDMMKNFTPPQMDSVSGKIEQATGIPGKDILEALNGDFVLSINGAPEGSAIPVEIMIGIGLDDESLQDKLIGKAGNFANVEKDGDFFMINANGMELYSGIVKGVWIITNVSGYKDAVSGEGLEKNLNDSKFSEYAGGSMGMYINLDLTTYPASLQAMMSSGGAPKMLEMLAESFSFIGIEGSNYKSDMVLKTSKEDENSLYTLLKLMDSVEKNK